MLSDETVDKWIQRFRYLIHYQVANHSRDHSQYDKKWYEEAVVQCERVKRFIWNSRKRLKEDTEYAILTKPLVHICNHALVYIRQRK